MALTPQQREELEAENAYEVKKAAAQQQRKYNLLSMLEPVAQAYQKNWATMETCIDASTAISLKRIADGLEQLVSVQRPDITVRSQTESEQIAGETGYKDE